MPQQKQEQTPSAQSALDLGRGLLMSWPPRSRQGTPSRRPRKSADRRLAIGQSCARPSSECPSMASDAKGDILSRKRYDQRVLREDEVLHDCMICASERERCSDSKLGQSGNSENTATTMRHSGCAESCTESWRTNAGFKAMGSGSMSLKLGDNDGGTCHRWIIRA